VVITWREAAGLSRPIGLPDHIEFHVALISLSQSMQRPGYKLWPNPKGIDHETGNPNPNTGAWNHSLYLDRGALDNEGNPQYLSYHTCSDESIIVQKIPFDEATWQAACGACTGNYGCHSNEMAVSSNYDKAKCRDTAEWGRAAVMEAANIAPVVENITSHWDHNNVYSGGPNDPRRHKCPYNMRFVDNYWPTFQQNVIAKWHIIRSARVASEQPPVPPPPPAPVYAKPILPDWFSRLDAVEHPSDQKWRNRTAYACKRNYRNVSRTATTRYSEPFKRGDTASPASGPKIAPGDKVFGIRLWVHPDDGRTWILEETGHWLLAAKFTPRVRIDPRTAD
jgi:hypothetical protein